MFSSLFFILLVLALINFVPDITIDVWLMNSSEAFIGGMLLYGILLLFIYLQAHWLSSFRQTYPILINIELLLFLCFYHFVLGSHRLFIQSGLAISQSLISLFSLLLYLIGLGWAHLCWQKKKHPFSVHSFRHAWSQVLFLLPFCLPFLFFSFLFDLLGTLSLWQRWMQTTDPFSYFFFLLGFSLSLLVIAMAIMPPLLMRFWQCKPIQNVDLANHLNTVCATLRFKHAGMKVWGIMKQTFTAGIVGIFPFARYLMFTPMLLSRFSREEIEAILVHEIGHNRYRHLLLYPFILMGMLLSGAVLLLLFNTFLWPIFLAPFPYFSLAAKQIFFTVALFICYGLLLGIYFRFVFGFFSRLFERQADLYIFEHTLSPWYMIQALDHIGVATGYTHHHPSWHHFSIQERIYFLQAAIQQPEIIQQHHRYVKKCLFLYFFVLAIACFSLFYFT